MILLYFGRQRNILQFKHIVCSGETFPTYSSLVRTRIFETMLVTYLEIPSLFAPPKSITVRARTVINQLMPRGD
jgi:hypothetical protein